MLLGYFHGTEFDHVLTLASFKTPYFHHSPIFF
ncbi:MAG: hypothetical protein ACI8UX_001179, partial [Psychromonas sp.]